uniref:Discs, large (Drosophila) homolog-associated protein 4b n=1 Tax=Periophthalmus magnuspinnatus TaxID=409849 RepID=A0A3B4BIF4_9GOBI
MKGLGVNRNRLLSDSCDPSSSHHREALYPPKNTMSSSSTLPRSPYLLTPAPMDRYGTMDPHLYSASAPDCVLNNQMPNSSTFPGLRTPMITSGSATISHHISKSQIPQSLLEFDKNLPGGRDGFSTLQFHRTTALANSKQRTDSPGKIRYMLNSVQKLFNKTQSMEGHQVKNVNGRSSGSGGGSSSAEDGGKQTRRAKSKDRGTKEPKRRPRSNMSGYWSSDDLDSSDVSSYHHTLGRLGTHDGLQSPQQRYIHSGYNTISSSKSSGEMKFSTPARGEGLGGLGGSWSTLTMGQPPRQLLQQGAHTLDRSMLKSKSCQQELSTNYLQVGRRHDWSSSLGRGGAMGRGLAMEIPCRRMRSGSYVKAMGDTADSDDSDLSPKPSPKSAARRQSYLRATQQSLTLLSSCNSKYGTLLHIDPYNCSRLDELHLTGSQDSPPDLPCDLPSHLPSDLPRPSCFRSRSHSYLRAIQAGCSQDEDSLSLESTSPPPTESSVRTYSNRGQKRKNIEFIEQILG